MFYVYSILPDLRYRVDHLNNKCCVLSDFIILFDYRLYDTITSHYEKDEDKASTYNYAASALSFKRVLLDEWGSYSTINKIYQLLPEEVTGLEDSIEHTCCSCFDTIKEAKDYVQDYLVPHIESRKITINTTKRK